MYLFSLSFITFPFCFCLSFHYVSQEYVSLPACLFVCIFLISLVNLLFSSSSSPILLFHFVHMFVCLFLFSFLIFFLILPDYLSLPFAFFCIFLHIRLHPLIVASGFVSLSMFSLRLSFLSLLGSLSLSFLPILSSFSFLPSSILFPFLPDFSFLALLLFSLSLPFFVYISSHYFFPCL